MPSAAFLGDETVANDLDEMGTVETGTGTETKYLRLKDAETVTDLFMREMHLNRIVTIGEVKI